MWGGNALAAAWNSATEAAKNAAAAVATGAEKVGTAVAQGMEAAKDEAFEAAQWTKEKVIEGAQWTKDKAVEAAQWAKNEAVAVGKLIAKKGQEAVALGKQAAKAVGQAINDVKNEFVAEIKAAAVLVECKASPLIAPEVRRAPPPNSTTAAAQQLSKHEKARQMADLADDAYNVKSGLPQDHPAQRVGGPGQTPPGLKGAVFDDPNSGFKASLYKTSDGNYVLAFAGTEDGKDWKANIWQGSGVESRQYQESVTLTRKVKDWVAAENKKNGTQSTLECTGHSLGGGLAATGAMASGLSATTFNMARPSANTMKKYGIDPDERGKSLDHYYVEGEVLTGAQEHTAPVTGAIGAVAGGVLFGPPGALIGGGVAASHYNSQIGKSVGNQESLPAVDDSGEPVSYEQASAVDRHYMKYVKNGLDKQIATDKQY